MEFLKPDYIYHDQTPYVIAIMLIFFQGYSFYFILIFSHLVWLRLRGWAVWVLNWVFGVEALYINKEE